ncbi:MAG: hypothetical protein AAF502_06175 [Bacteroidota bacterium]
MESSITTVFFKNIQNPFQQLAIVLATSGFIMLIGFLIKASGATVVSPEFPWLTSAAFILVYSVLTAVAAISSADIESYFRKSILAFVALIIASGLLASLFSGISINSAGTYKYIYVILVIVYLALLSIGGIIKRISMAIQREEDAYVSSQKNNNN